MLFTIEISHRFDDGYALFDVFDNTGLKVIFAKLQDGETCVFEYRHEKYILVVNKFAVVCELVVASEFVPFTYRGEDSDTNKTS